MAERAVENASDAVAVLDAEGRVLEVNDAYHRITGRSTSEVLGRALPDPISESAHDAAFYRFVWETLRAEGHWSGELWLTRPSGERYQASFTASTVADGEGPCRYVVVFNDLSLHRRYEARLDFLAYYDPLTQLLNRIGLVRALHDAIERRRDKQQGPALLAVDIDRFKHVNDSLGHGIGDRLVREAGDRIRDLLGPRDVAARFSGDEFMVVLAEGVSEEETERQAERIRAALAEPFEIGEHALYMTASIGICLCPHGGETAEQMLSNADATLHRAKAAGGDNFRRFSRAIEAEAQSHLTIASALGRALERRELNLAYQPIVNLWNGQIEAVEVLLRWRHPKAGAIPPDRFIPMAEHTGRIHEIGEWVLRSACAEAVEWQGGEGPAPRVAVNQSARQLQRPDAVEQIARVLADTGLPPERLELEITETTLVEEPRRTSAMLRELSSMGIAISLDDFGTGYSCLSHLRLLPVDHVKIDRTFLYNGPGDSDEAAIVRAVIALARSLKLRTIAEGIESEQQWRWLRGLGCHRGQGYWLSPPVPVEELTRLRQQPHCLPVGAVEELGAR